MRVQVVTGTGFHGDARSKFKEAVEALGLVCAGSLVLGTTDVLVVAAEALQKLSKEGLRGRQDSEKIVMARLWQLSIVSHDWVKACQAAKRVVRTEDFLIDFSQWETDAQLAQQQGLDDLSGPVSSLHSTGSNSFDLRSSYPPSGLSRMRTVSVKEDSWHDKEPVSSPKSPVSILTEPFELLRSRMSGSKRAPAAHASSPHTSAFELFCVPNFEESGLYKHAEPDPGHQGREQSAAASMASAAHIHAPMPPSPPADSVVFPHDVLTFLNELDIEDTDASRTSNIQELQVATPASVKGSRMSSPASIEVKVLDELPKAPKKSTAADFHRCAAKALTYFDKLEVKDPESGTCYRFAMSDPSHCALVFYDDSADGHELAYCDLLSTYRTSDGEIFIEHGYLFDRADVLAHPNGAQLMASHCVAEDELVNCASIYHSPASVIEGEFWLYGSQSQAQRARKRCTDQNQLHLFTSKTWDRKAGRFLARPKNVRFCS